MKKENQLLIITAKSVKKHEIFEKIKTTKRHDTIIINNLNAFMMGVQKSRCRLQKKIKKVSRDWVRQIA